ncbi:DUF2273 domain-containing protein [Cellulomonas cellasea]|uniref:DUF2273 domain-containing protein n=1 Tax=Cellulomonas cellasea TaxID=43670 RepID=UPI0025A4B394|nr:DUF2273 domain-containing protein [Cellulomonas cellasea]MDM8084599.1 DUF2273 domain-containing protein [Cellulomonas cellasea]
MSATVIGIFVGILLAIAAILGGFGGFLLALGLGLIGLVVGAQIEGRVDLGSMVQAGRRRG